jgi:uncharacterized protein (TIGR02145 family)
MKTIGFTGKHTTFIIKFLILFTFSFYLFPFSLRAQSPEKMSYQAVIRDANDDLVAGSTVGMQVSILQGSAEGTAVYVETHTPATNANGLMTIEIGAGTGVSGDFSAIDWSAGPYFLKTETDPAGGTNYTITGTSQLLSVPYALHSNTTDSLSDIDLSAFATIDMQNQNITNLADPVSDQDAATKTYVDAIITQLYEQGSIRVRDNDGNYYNTVKIGDQIWMAENLRTTNYNDGTAIPYVTDTVDWSNLTTDAYCWFANNTVYKDTYGALYNWYTVNTGKLCPAGWHVPTDAEWTVLTDYLGGESVAGGKMKETGTAHWYSPNNATNESGFTALPGGFRPNNGYFQDIRYNGRWWSSTENSGTNAWYRNINNSGVDVYRNYENKKSGYSVRCLKD